MVEFKRQFTKNTGNSSIIRRSEFNYDILEDIFNLLPKPFEKQAGLYARVVSVIV